MGRSIGQLFGYKSLCALLSYTAIIMMKKKPTKHTHSLSKHIFSQLNSVSVCWESMNSPKNIPTSHAPTIAHFPYFVIQRSLPRCTSCVVLFCTLHKNQITMSGYDISNFICIEQPALKDTVVVVGETTIGRICIHRLETSLHSSIICWFLLTSLCMRTPCLQIEAEATTNYSDTSRTDLIFVCS